jgi:hypothetical protein
MPKTVAIALSPTPTLLGRLLATIDRVLMVNAEIAVRNGDLPHVGL